MRRIATLLITLSAVVSFEARVFSQRPSAPRQKATASTACIASSSDFVVRSYPGGPRASELLVACERLRKELQTTWLGAESPTSWRPPCEVVVHSSRAGYQQAVGPASGPTFGSSLIRFNRGQVALRRIDLLPNAAGQTTALPHELAHVVLADRFAGRQPPRWVDEGVATLADAWEKQQRHQRDCQYALHAGTALPLNDLVRLEQCTSMDQAAAFYSQSLSLVSYFLEQDTPERFLALVELAMEKGYDHALREIYGIESLSRLDRQWREFAMAPPPPAAETRLTSFERAGQEP